LIDGSELQSIILGALQGRPARAIVERVLSFLTLAVRATSNFAGRL
jgi:hypothetical protein